MSIGGLPALNDGNNARAVLYDRLIEQYNVQMFISAGNSGPGVNTDRRPVGGDQGGRASAPTSPRPPGSRNYGSTSPAAGTDNLHPFSSRGPREDGGFKPTDRRARRGGLDDPALAAGRPGGRHLRPAAGLRDVQRHVDGLAAGGRRGGAARQRGQGRPASSTSRRSCARRCNSSARFLDASYRRLRAGQRPARRRRAPGTCCRRNVKTVDIARRCRSTRVLERLPGDPGRRRGHPRPRGRHAGHSLHPDRTRSPAPAAASGSVTYNLTWVGNDGTFSSARRRSRCRKDTPVTLHGDGQPDDRTAPTRRSSTSTTRHAGHRLPDDEHGHRARRLHRGQQLRADVHRHGRPQPGAAATSSASRPAPRVQGRLLRPDAPRPAPARSGSCGSTRTASGSTATRARSATRRRAGRLVPRGGPTQPDDVEPAGGVWEVTVEARRTSDADVHAVHADGVDPRAPRSRRTRT